MLRRDIIREIVKRDFQNQKLNEESVIKEAKSLYDAACEHFGAWEIALRYAGIDGRYFRYDYDGHSRKRVILAIRKLCVSGYNLSATRSRHRDNKLYRAAVHYFGCWKNALETAGIDCQNLQMDKRLQQHDKQKIIDTLRERHNAGLTIMWSELCLENRSFALAAKQAFGSWSRALVAAGILPEGQRIPHNKKWDEVKVVAHIQERHRQNKSLARKTVNKEDPSLVHAVSRYFGHWETALEAAGIAKKDREQIKKNE